MAEWFWNLTVALHDWTHKVAGAGNDEMNTWLIIGGILLLGIGGFLHYLVASLSGIKESLSENSDEKSSFFLMLGYLLFPVDVGWCHYKQWSNVSGIGHFFAWIFFLYFAMLIVFKIVHVLRLLFHGHFLETFLKLLSIVTIYLGVVIFSGWLGTIIIVGFVIAAILMPSGGRSSGGGSGGGGRSSGPQPPESSSYNGGDRVYHDGALWEHDGTWSGEPWHRV